MPEVSEDFKFTVSCGVAVRSLHMVGVEALVDQADQALLIAKRSGRNRYVRFDDVEALPALMENPGEKDDRTSAIAHPALVPFQVVNTLLAALKYRDPATVEHTQRVAQLCRELGQFLGLDPEARVLVEVAGLMHDVGRLTIPDAILTKTGRLSDEEFAVAQRHHEVTVELLNACFTNKQLVEVVRCSSRWWDGSHGSPSGEELPLAARILAVASFFDDVQNGRGWWSQHDTRSALEVLAASAGTQFDPVLVERFIAMIAQQDHDRIEEPKIELVG